MMQTSEATDAPCGCGIDEPQQPPPPPSQMDLPYDGSTRQPLEGPQAAGQEERPAPGAGQEEDDITSHLPADVMCHIISLLHFRDGARTQILSSRWRRFWHSAGAAPINLDHRDLQWRRYTHEDVASLTTRALASHSAPVRLLAVHAVHLHRGPAIVDAWLRSPAVDGLEELEFVIGGLYDLAPEPPLPASAFRFWATLRVAAFAKCQFPDEGALRFPELRKLGLHDVVISEDSLHGIIAGCPVLESLPLTGRSRFECIRINSPSLVSIGLRVYTDELIIEDAPLLERLLQLEFGIATNLSVISAPKLETLGCLSDLDFYSKLTAEPTVLQELSADSSVTVVSSVKILAINISSLSIDMFVDLMRCFPCVEKLYIQTLNVSGDKNFWQDDVIKSLDIRLNTVMLRMYEGKWSQINLATFFVLKAKMLESMTFEGPRNGTRKFIREQHKLLPLERRASRVAQFHFKSATCYHFLPCISHIRDLSKPDLFKCDSDCNF